MVLASKTFTELESNFLTRKATLFDPMICCSEVMAIAILQNRFLRRAQIAEMTKACVARDLRILYKCEK